jgi:hypothetical protein
MYYETILCKIVQKRFIIVMFFSTTDHLTIFSFLKKKRQSECSCQNLFVSFFNKKNVQDHILMQIKNELKSEKFQQSPGSVRMSLFIVDIPILYIINDYMC